MEIFIIENSHKNDRTFEIQIKVRSFFRDFLRINKDYHQPSSFIHNPPTPNQMTNERMETIKLTPHH